jgi:Holliday junction resolvasome RuvABC endonuclease subunit
MPAILALDLGSTTGYAHSDGTSGVWNFPATKHPGNRWQKVADVMFGCLWEHHTEIVAVERPHLRGWFATKLALAMLAEVERMAATYGADVRLYHTATIKKHATRNSKATKEEMVAAAVARNPGRKYCDHNEIDALWLLDLALSEA